MLSQIPSIAKVVVPLNQLDLITFGEAEFVWRPGLEGVDHHQDVARLGLVRQLCLLACGHTEDCAEEMEISQLGSQTIVAELVQEDTV